MSESPHPVWSDLASAGHIYIYIYIYIHIYICIFGLGFLFRNRASYREVLRVEVHFLLHWVWRCKSFIPQEDVYSSCTLVTV